MDGYPTDSRGGHLGGRVVLWCMCVIRSLTRPLSAIGEADVSCLATLEGVRWCDGCHWEDGCPLYYWSSLLALLYTHEVVTMSLLHCLP